MLIKKLYFIYLNKGKRVKLYKNCEIGINSTFEGMNVIHEGTYFSGSIGYGSYISRNCSIKGKIGRFSCIASDVSTINTTHPTRNFVSIHPVFYSIYKQNGETYINEQKFDEFLFADKEKKHNVIIKNDVWIGSGVKIIGGVTIGDGAIIAAGAVVTKDVEPYSIVGGVPGKIIRKRFLDEQIDFLLKLRWWDKPIEWIKENSYLFSDIDIFMKNVGRI